MIKHWNAIKFYLMALSAKKATVASGQSVNTSSSAIKNEQYQKLAAVSKCTYNKTAGQNPGKNHPLIGAPEVPQTALVPVTEKNPNALIAIDNLPKKTTALMITDEEAKKLFAKINTIQKNQVYA